MSRRAQKATLLDEDEEMKISEPLIKEPIRVERTAQVRKSKIGSNISYHQLISGLGGLGLKFTPQSRDKLVTFPHEQEEGEAEIEGGMSLVNYF